MYLLPVSLTRARFDARYDLSSGSHGCVVGNTVTFLYFFYYQNYVDFKSGMYNGRAGLTHCIVVFSDDCSDIGIYRLSHHLTWGSLLKMLLGASYGLKRSAKK
jgi:hypothetical protein